MLPAAEPPAITNETMAPRPHTVAPTTISSSTSGRNSSLLTWLSVVAASIGHSISQPSTTKVVAATATPTITPRVGPAPLPTRPAAVPVTTAAISRGGAVTNTDRSFTVHSSPRSGVPPNASPSIQGSRMSGSPG